MIANIILLLFCQLVLNNALECYTCHDCNTVNGNTAIKTCNTKRNLCKVTKVQVKKPIGILTTSLDKSVLSILLSKTFHRLETIIVRECSTFSCEPEHDHEVYCRTCSANKCNKEPIDW